MTEDARRQLAQDIQALTRRSFIQGGVGLGLVAAGGLLGGKAIGQAVAGGGIGRRSASGSIVDKGVLNSGHFPARAQRVISSTCCGAVSQVDTFDYKPQLVKMHGQEIPPSVKNKGGRMSAMSNAQSAFPLVAPLRPVPAIRRMRRLGERPVPLRGPHCRRHLRSSTP